MSRWMSPIDRDRELGPGDEADYEEPRESCKDCGEWLKPGQQQRDCDNCKENAADAAST